MADLNGYCWNMRFINGVSLSMCQEESEIETGNGASLTISTNVTNVKAIRPCVFSCEQENPKLAGIY